MVQRPAAYRGRQPTVTRPRLVGMGTLALESGEPFGLLLGSCLLSRGTTIQGVRALERGGLRSLPLWRRSSRRL